MKLKASSSRRACAPFFLAVAHIIGCTGEATSIGGGGGDDDLLIGAQEPGGPDVFPGVPALALYRFSADGSWAEKIDPGPVLLLKLSKHHTRMVVHRGDETMYFMGLDGRNHAALHVPNLATTFFTQTVIAISPSGHYVAYGVGTSSFERAVYVARTDGSAGELVFSKGPNIWAWAPMEDKLAVGGSNAPLHIYDADAHTFVEATSSGSKLGADTDIFSWTRDGERLAFVEKLPNDTVLTTVDKQGHDRRVLLTNVQLPMHRGSSWSPDGQTFALMQYMGNPNGLRLVNATGTMTRDIADAFLATSLGWSPTGHFVYLQYDSAIKSVTLSGETVDLAGPYAGCPVLGPNGRLVHVEAGAMTINADGSNPIYYTQIPNGSCYTTQLSNDGKFIAFGPHLSTPVYVGASDDDQATMVLPSGVKSNDMKLLPIVGSGGIIFDGTEQPGWILPTNSGFQAVYPQLKLAYIGWGYAVQTSF